MSQPRGVRAALKGGLAILVLAGALLAPARTGPAVAAGTVRPTAPTVLILWPGQLQVSRPGRADVFIRLPPRLDLGDLVGLVNDPALVADRPGGGVELHVPIEQRAGSRLSISSRTVPELWLRDGARLTGNRALLSVNGVDLTADGVTSGAAQPLVAYDGGSSVRMSRVRIEDHRSGPGAGPAIGISRSAELHLTSVQVSGGGGIRVDDAHPCELIGVQIDGARGAGLAATGSTQLRLRDLTVRASSGDGLLLVGNGVRLRTGGVIRSTGNGGLAVRLVGAGRIAPGDLRISTDPVASPGAPPGSLLRPARSAGVAQTAGNAGQRLRLTWVFGAGLILFGAATAVEFGWRPRLRR